MSNESCPIPPPPQPHPIRRFFRQTGPAGPVALIATAMPLIGAGLIAGFARELVPLLRAHQPLSIVPFVLSFAILAGFALVPTYVNSFLGGYTFKFALGFPVVTAGLIGAATVSYVVARKIVGHRVSNTIAEHPRWQIVRDALIGGSTAKVIGVITLLRLSPVLPFETSNVLLASCEVKLVPYLIGTVLGVSPRTAALVFIASRAARFDMDTPEQRWIFAGGIVATVVVIVVLGVISKHALARACVVKPEIRNPKSE